MNSNLEQIYTISEIQQQLEELKQKYGDISVAIIDFGNPDYHQEPEVLSVKPCVVSHPTEIGKYLIVFD